MKKITALGIIKSGKLAINSRKVFADDLTKAPNGKVKITVEKYYRKASILQFGYLYGVILPLSWIALNDAGYEFTNVDQVDQFWKSMFATKEILNRETGEVMTLPLSKSEFKTIDEMVYSDKIREYVAEYLNTVIPDPDINYKQKRNV